MGYRNGKILRRIDRKVDQIHEWLKDDNDRWDCQRLLIKQFTRDLKIATNELLAVVARHQKVLDKNSQSNQE